MKKCISSNVLWVFIMIYARGGYIHHRLSNSVDAGGELTRSSYERGVLWRIALEAYYSSSGIQPYPNGAEVRIDGTAYHKY